MLPGPPQVSLVCQFDTGTQLSTLYSTCPVRQMYSLPMASAQVAEDRTGYQPRPRSTVLVAADLSDLQGPTHGTLELPLRLFWSAPDRTFDLDDADALRSMYEKVLRTAARTEELSAYLNGDRLADVWADLFLPRDLRRAWEDQHPVLRRSPAAV
jgi:hypothetical protein